MFLTPQGKMAAPTTMFRNFNFHFNIKWGGGGVNCCEIVVPISVGKACDFFFHRDPHEVALGCKSDQNPQDKLHQSIKQDENRLKTKWIK